MALLAAALLSGCETPTADGDGPAYDPTRLTGGVLYRWPLGATVAIHVPDGTASAPLKRAVQQGLAAWSSAWQYAELRPVLVPSPLEADVVVQVAGDPPVVVTEDCAATMIGAAGRTILCAAGDTARTLPLTGAAGEPGGVPGRVKVLVLVDGRLVSEGQGEQFQAVVSHELGHMLGLGGHSDSEGDLMYPAPAVTVPTERDAATLSYVLHQPPTLLLRPPPR